MNTGQQYVLAFDIGGTNIRAGIIDVEGRLIGEQMRFPVPFLAARQADPDAVIAAMAAPIAYARQQIGEPLAIGLSLCGNINIERGEAVLVPNLGWRRVPFAAMVTTHYDLPVYAATDVRQAALAEALWGCARDRRHFAWATIGTGYGGYLFLDGRLYRGTHGFAGNFGHITWDERTGETCGCGRKGCFETFVSGPAIARAGEQAARHGTSEALTAQYHNGPITTAMVFAAAEAGDTGAVRILDETIRLICINLGGIVNLLDLELIVLGGGVVHAAPWFVERIRERIPAHLMTIEAQQNLELAVETLPNSALWGAAAHALAMLKQVDAGLLESDLRHSPRPDDKITL